MKACKQISLEELFRLYPQLQPVAGCEEPQAGEGDGHEGQSRLADTAAISSAEA